MKEFYTKPITTVEQFKTIDVVTTSIDDMQKGDNDVNFGD